MSMLCERCVIVDICGSFGRWYFMSCCVTWLSLVPFSVLSDSLWPCGLSTPGSLSFPTFWSLLRLVSIELAMLSTRLALHRPRLLLPSVSPSIRVFSSELALLFRSSKYWSFICSLSSCNEYSGFTISFRIDWFHLLAVQGTQFSKMMFHIMFYCSTWLLRV